MFKDPEKAKQYWKEKKRKQRMSNPDVSAIVQPVMSNPKEAIMSNPGCYPAIVYALVDPIKRDKLQRICKSLDKKLADGSNLLNIVHYGTSDYIPMSKVKELLEVTE